MFNQGIKTIHCSFKRLTSLLDRIMDDENYSVFTYKGEIAVTRHFVNKTKVYKLTSLPEQKEMAYNHLLEWASNQPKKLPTNFKTCKKKKTWNIKEGSQKVNTRQRSCDRAHGFWEQGQRMLVKKMEIAKKHNS